MPEAVGDVLASEYSEKSPVFKFEGLEPNKYFMSITNNDNNNNQWGPNNFSEKKTS